MSQTPLSRALDFVKARRDAGLSDETLHVLLLLRRQRVMTRQQIAEETSINPTTLPRYLSALLASGHLEKLQGEDDKREKLFRLSGHGLRLVSSLIKHFPAEEKLRVES